MILATEVSHGWYPNPGSPGYKPSGLPVSFTTIQLLQSKKMRRLLLLHIIMRLSLTIMADTSIMLGAVLSDYQNVDYFNNAISKLQSPPGYAYSNVSILIDRNPLVAAKDICDQLLPQRVSFNAFS